MVGRNKVITLCGSSARSEIGYAVANGCEVRYLEPVK